MYVVVLLVLGLVLEILGILRVLEVVLRVVLQEEEKGGGGEEE